VGPRSTPVHVYQKCLMVAPVHPADNWTFDPRRALREDRSTGPTRCPLDPFELVDLVTGQFAEVGRDITLVRPQEMKTGRVALIRVAHFGTLPFIQSGRASPSSLLCGWSTSANCAGTSCSRALSASRWPRAA
jgi:hypothetical protein